MSTPTTGPTNTKGALNALMAYGLFSAHDVIVKALGGGYSPFQIVFFSALMGFPFVALMLMQDDTKGNLRPVHPLWMTARTIASIFTGACAFYAFSVLPLAQTYAIIFASPLLITVLSIPILGEVVRLRRWLAVIVGLIGVLVVLRPGSVPIGLGHLAALGCAIGGAFNSIIVRKIGQEERSAVLMMYPMLATVIVMGALMPFYYKPMPALDFGGMALVALFAFLAVRFLIAAYRNGEAVIVAPMQYSQIIWATIFGLLFFNEIPDTPTIIGAGIIIASGIYILIRESAAGASENTPVLRTRSRIGTGNGLRVGTFVRRITSSE
ncbi:DMT family transporter [Aliiroseovarius sp. YM-037]|uniref:DMT family transporter n=1 Tax=Aliiroseovarius sp. YM-037 TaxID=3341728 RepID=UPI003A7FAD19